MTPTERLVANGNTIINFLKEFSHSDAKDISISWIENDGTVVTKTFANIAKFQAAVNLKFENGVIKTSAGVPIDIDAATVGGYTAEQLLDTSGLNFKMLIDTRKSFPQRWMLGVTKDNEIIHWGDDEFFVAGESRLVSHSGNNHKNSSTNTVPQPTEKQGANIKKIVASAAAWMVLYEDGDLYSIGFGFYGQLGQGNTTDYNHLRLVLRNIRDVTTSSHGYHAEFNTWMAVDNNGGLWSWGQNFYGQCGSGDTVVQRTPGLRTIVGLNANETVDQIYVCDTHDTSTYVLTTEGRVFSCGWNGDGGCLGLGDTVHRNTFQPVGHGLVGKVVTHLEVAGGVRQNNLKLLRHSVVAVTNTGEIYSWGHNGDSELGLGDTINRSTPTKVNITPAGTGKFVEVVGSKSSFTCYFALTDDGELWAWGANRYGQCGLGNSNPQPTPLRVTLVNVDGTPNTSGVKKAYILAGVSLGHYHTSLIITNDGKVFCAGTGAKGQLGTGALPIKTSFVEPRFAYGAQIVQVSEGGYGINSFWNVLLDDGRVMGWGSNASHEVQVHNPRTYCTTPKMVHT